MNHIKLINGLYSDHLEKVSRILRNYEIYAGDQSWEIRGKLDYTPTKKITNYVKKLIDTKARFMFGKEPFLDVRSIEADEGESTFYDDQAQEKEDLLHKILKDNKFHSKLLKGMKDCLIGGKVAIKLWAQEDKGIKLIFSPAQEFFPVYDIDDVDELEKVTFLYALNTEDTHKDQRFKRQEFEMVKGKCILNEGIYDGSGKAITIIEQDHNTKLDFIPVIVIQNDGLTGEIDGVSDVEQLWSNQDTYNRLTSDDIDALKFDLFGQDVITNADVDSLEGIVKAPGAVIDLQTDIVQAELGNSASVERLESKFSYSEKFVDTINRVKNDMHDVVDVPNISLDQLQGVISSGKGMETLYWGLIAVCEEKATEWEPALEQMTEFIFKMVEVYNLYGAKAIASVATTLRIERTYPIAKDVITEKKMDLDEVVTEVRSKKSYINKHKVSENIEEEIEQIQREKQMLQDSYTQDLMADLTDDPNDDDAEADEDEDERVN